MPRCICFVLRLVFRFLFLFVSQLLASYFLICFLLIFLRMSNKLICISKKQGGDTLTKYKKIDCPLFVKNIEICSVRISCKCVIINFEFIILEIKNFKIKSNQFQKSPGPKYFFFICRNLSLWTIAKKKILN